MNRLPDFNQICMDITLGHDEELIFKVTAGLKLPNISQKVIVCRVSHEPVGGFQPDIHAYNIRA